MGHHDPMYEWARRQGHYTDLDAYGVVWARPESADNRDSAVPPTDFEEWTLYLPEQQRKLVNRRYHVGLGRVRGAAGTGKTVVALHRAAVLGHRYPGERILVTTFSRSLCNHMNALFQRFPNAPDNVHFANVDKLAFQFDRRPLDLDAVDEAFEAAYTSTVPLDTRRRGLTATTCGKKSGLSSRGGMQRRSYTWMPAGSNGWAGEDPSRSRTGRYVGACARLGIGRWRNVKPSTSLIAL